MRAEIADSDEEIDMTTLPPPEHKDKNNDDVTITTEVLAGQAVHDAQFNLPLQSTLERLEQDPILGLAFDEFLSPSVHGSSLHLSQERRIYGYSQSGVGSSQDAVPVSTTPATSVSAVTTSRSAASKLAAIESGRNFDASMGKRKRTATSTSTSPAVNKKAKKRAQSEVDVGGNEHAHIHETAVRRTKTYGSSKAQTGAKSVERSLFADDSEDAQGAHQHRLHEHEGESAVIRNDVSDSGPFNADTRTSEQQVLENNLPTTCAEYLTGSDGGSYRPQPNSSFQRMVGLQSMTTMNSSIGGYQSFNLSGNGAGLNYATNPFGQITLSQLSMDGESNNRDDEALQNIFKAVPFVDANDPVNSQDQDTSESYLPRDLQEEEEPTERRGRTQPLKSPTVSLISQPDDSLQETVQDSGMGVPGVTEERSSKDDQTKQPKKRGRKPKNARTSSKVSNDVDDTEHLDSRQHGSRAGTVESQASETSQAVKAGSALMPPPSPRKDDSSPKKNVSSDLGLDDEDVIGVAADRYVPRLSRRRSRAIDEAAQRQPELQEDRMTSGVQEADVPAETTVPSPPKPAATKGKKGRKSKVKRAKTSAASLLKLKSDFLDDDEREESKEVIYVSEQPAKIKMGPLAEIGSKRGLKKEEIETEDQPDSASITKEEHKGEGDDESSPKKDERSKVEKHDQASPIKDSSLEASQEVARISIDVPALPEPDENSSALSRTPPPQPKKRGRKRKQQANVSAENGEDGCDQSNEQSTSRPALAEKDSNPRTGRAKRTVEEEKDNEDENRNGRTLEGQDHGDDRPPESPSPSKMTSKARPTHSPLKPSTPAPGTPVNRNTGTPASAGLSSLFSSKYRIGLSKRHSIPSLLRRVDRTREPPKVVEKKEKLTKRQQEELEKRKLEVEDGGGDTADGMGGLRRDRGDDGMLIEWND